MQNEIMVEIITYNPSMVNHCVDCETIWREIENIPHTHLEQIIAHQPADLAYEYRVVSEWAADIRDRFAHQIHIHVLDAVSVEGINKSADYGINFYPAVIVDHHFVYSLGMLDQATDEISRIIEQHQHQPSH